MLLSLGSRDTHLNLEDFVSNYGQTPPPPPSQSPQDQAKGFFGALLDFKFNHFITPMIVKFVYVLATIVLVLGFVVFLVASFANSASAGIVVLLLGPVVVILYLAFIRMTLEFYLAIVRMSEDIHRRP